MYVILILRCILFYFLLIFALRFMGKREVGELSVFDIVIYLVMSELLALAVTETDESIFKAIIPIATLALLQVGVSFILLKSKKLRDIVDGVPVILIKDGILNQNEMKKQRYNIDDLMSQLRNKDIDCLEDVKFAILENNGTLSVFKKKDCNVLHPEALIQDGILNKRVLQDLHKDDEWLYKKLHRQGYNNIDEIFLAMVKENGFYILPKNSYKKKRKFHTKTGGSNEK